MVDKERAVTALMLGAIVVVTSCGGTSSSLSPSQASNKAATTQSSSNASQSTAPTMFRSALYGYAVTLPKGWTSKQATYPYKWDGQSELDIESAEVDKFMSTSSLQAWAVARPWKQDLAAYTRFSIAWTSRYHGDNCPAEPETTKPVTIGGQPGVLLAYNCGILINVAEAVHGAFGYWFTFRDEGVQAASDPTDHASILKVLASVQLPA